MACFLFLHHHPYCNIYSIIDCSVYILCFLISLPLIIISMSIIKGIVDSFSNFLFSISYAGLGIVLFVVTMKITQNLYRLVLKYLTWYIQTVKGRIKQ
ncbi:DUF1700 domain-containing protein [Staphylococcus haemolyticus]